MFGWDFGRITPGDQGRSGETGKGPFRPFGARDIVMRSSLAHDEDDVTIPRSQNHGIQDLLAFISWEPEELSLPGELLAEAIRPVGCRG